MADVEVIKATGMVNLRFAMPFLKSSGPADRAPESATKSPAHLTKSRWKGKNPLMIGTNSTPPPTPPNTATIPIRKAVTNSNRGQTHHVTPLLIEADRDWAVAKVGFVTSNNIIRVISLNISFIGKNSLSRKAAAPYFPLSYRIG
jgi:hypothetical protein